MTPPPPTPVDPPRSPEAPERFASTDREDVQRLLARILARRWIATRSGPESTPDPVTTSNRRRPADREVDKPI